MTADTQEHARARFILADRYALRGWLFSPHCLLDLKFRSVTRLSAEEFETLARCDGTHEDGATPTLARFIEKGIVRPCGEGEHLAPEQRYRTYDNWLFESVHWAITGRCNFNCIHCFAAAGTAPTTGELNLDGCLRIIDEFEHAGIQRVYLTGGEPLLRSDFLDITEALAQHGIRVESIGTNGSLVTDEFLDALEAQGHRPNFLVSFDGIGHHDWMRGVKGAEERTLAGIRRIKAHGLRVSATSCLSRGNLDTVRETTRLLEEMGVDLLRVVRVAESLRWIEEAPGMNLPVEEYLEFILGYVDWFLGEDIPMDVEIWGILHHAAGSATCLLTQWHDCSPASDHLQSCCGDARRMPFVAHDGEIALCNQMSGYVHSGGIRWGNVPETPLPELFRDSPFTDQLLCTQELIRAHNPACLTCEWRGQCNCGCRANALADSRDIMGTDPLTCVFFRKGYFDRFREMVARHGFEACPAD